MYDESIVTFGQVVDKTHSLAQGWVCFILIQENAHKMVPSMEYHLSVYVFQGDFFFSLLNSSKDLLHVFSFPFTFKINNKQTT